MRCSDALAPYRRASLAFAWRYPPVRLSSFLPSARRRPRAWSFWVWQLPASVSGRETTGPLRFLGNPGVLMPCSWTPAGLQRQAIRRLQHGPRGGEDEGSHEQAFRGSIAELRHALSTLRRLGRPNTTQDSLLGAWPASQAGLATRRVSTKDFRSASYIPSSFPSFPDATPPATRAS